MLTERKISFGPFLGVIVLAIRTGLPIIHYWHDRDHPEQIARALAAFKAHNPDFQQLVFDEHAAARFIATHYGEREVAAFRACALPAMQADYLRYCAVHALGGVYADANFKCTGSVRRLVEDSQGTLFGRQDPVPDWLAAAYNWPHLVGEFRAVVNGLFGFRASGHPLLGLAIRIATANVEQRVADGAAGVWLATGPGIFTSVYLLHELGSFDAFLQYSIGTAIEPSAPLLCEILEDVTEITRAWEEVRIDPIGEMEASGVVWGSKFRGGSAEFSRWTRAGQGIFR